MSKKSVVLPLPQEEIERIAKKIEEHLNGYYNSTSNEKNELFEVAKKIAQLLPDVDTFNATQMMIDNNTNRPWLRIRTYEKDDFDLGDMGVLYSYQMHPQPKRKRANRGIEDLKMTYFCDHPELCEAAATDSMFIWAVYNVMPLKLLEINGWRHKFLQMFHKEHIDFKVLEAIISRYLKEQQLDGWKAYANMDQSRDMKVSPEKLDTTQEYGNPESARWTYRPEYALFRANFFDYFEFIARYLRTGYNTRTEYDGDEPLETFDQANTGHRVIFAKDVDDDSTCFTNIQNFRTRDYHVELWPIETEYCRRRNFVKMLLDKHTDSNHSPNNVIKLFNQNKKLKLEKHHLVWILFQHRCLEWKPPSYIWHDSHLYSHTKSYCSRLAIANFGMKVRCNIVTGTTRLDIINKVEVEVRIYALNNEASNCFREMNSRIIYHTELREFLRDTLESLSGTQTFRDKLLNEPIELELMRSELKGFNAEDTSVAYDKNSNIISYEIGENGQSIDVIVFKHIFSYAYDEMEYEDRNAEDNYDDYFMKRYEYEWDGEEDGGWNMWTLNEKKQKKLTSYLQRTFTNNSWIMIQQLWFGKERINTIRKLRKFKYDLKKKYGSKYEYTKEDRVNILELEDEFIHGNDEEPTIMNAMNKLLPTVYLGRLQFSRALRNGLKSITFKTSQTGWSVDLPLFSKPEVKMQTAFARIMSVGLVEYKKETEEWKRLDELKTKELQQRIKDIITRKKTEFAKELAKISMALRSAVGQLKF